MTRPPASDSAAALAGLDLFELISHTVADLVYISRPDGTMVWMSESARRVLGWGQQQGPDLNAWDLVHPDDQQVLVRALESRNGAEPISYDLRLLQSDGTYRWMALRSAALLDDSGAVQFQVGVARDIETRMVSRRALADSEERMRLALANSGIPTALVAPTGEFLTANRALCQMLERDEATLLASSWQELTHPADLAADEALVAQVLAGEREGYRLRKRYLRPSGATIVGDLSVSCVRGPGGRVRFFVAQILDVSELMAEKARAEQAERHLTILAERASDVVYAADANRRVVWIAPSVAEVLGWTPDELVGTVLADLVRPGDREATEGTRSELYSGRAPGGRTGMLVQVRTKAGEYRWFDARARSVLTPDGQPDGVVAGLRDVTELMTEIHQRQGLLDAMIDPHLLLQPVDATGQAVTGRELAEVVDFRYVEVNGAACAAMGVPREVLIGAIVSEVAPAHVQAISQAFARVVTEGVLAVDDVSLAQFGVPDESRYDIRAVLVDGRVSLTWRDVSDRHRERLSRAESEEKFRLLAENASDLVVLMRDGVCQWASPSSLEVVGRTESELLGTDLMAMVHPMDRKAAEVAMRPSSAAPRRRFRVRRPSGAVIWLDARARSYRSDQGREEVVVGLRNVTREVAAERSLAASESMFRQLAENNADTIMQTGPDTTVQWVSRSIADLLEWTPQHALGAPLMQLVHPDDAGRLAALQATVSGGRAATSKLRMRTASGSHRWLAVTVKPVTAEEPETSPQIWSLRDAELDVADREMLAELAASDPLTGLPNRTRLTRALNDRLARQPRLGALLGLAFLDVDRFKTINDTMGHDFGDRVLRMIAVAATRAIRSSDLVARLGGDEFVVMLDGLGHRDDAAWIADKVRSRIAESLASLGLPNPPTVSIGITVAAPGDTAEELLRHADRAMYRAKALGGDRIQTSW